MRENDMTANDRARRRPSSAKGFSLVELLAVVAIIGTMAAISLPPFISTRRALRTTGTIRVIVSHMRDARQQAISRRRAITFQYDDANKKVNLIDYGVDANGMGISGPKVVKDANYPNNTGSTVIRTVSLSEAGAPTTELMYGLAPEVLAEVTDTKGVVTKDLTYLDDQTTLAALDSKNKVNITFQPDGTIIDANGVPHSAALFIYNKVQPKETTTAISVLGGTGRIKAWRYSSSAKSFIE
jgi:prepilin-type N-terminal cleavage/methylation domain-containing protein